MSQCSETPLATSSLSGKSPDFDALSESSIISAVEGQDIDSSVDNNSESPVEELDYLQIADGYSPRQKVEVKEYLLDKGIGDFLEHYVMCDSAPYTIPELILLLGFVLPNNIMNDQTLFGQELLFLHLTNSMKRVVASKQRHRLSGLTEISQLWPILETAKNIIVLTGAGISTSLGIPDFRSDMGLYTKLAAMGISDPQQVFNQTVFKNDPKIFYQVARNILPPKEKITPTHAFIKVLQDRGKLLRNYTQNIDNLEFHSGIQNDKIIQCHGSFAKATCQTCGYKCLGSDIYPQIRSQTVAMCPLCEKRDDDKIPEAVRLSPIYGVMKPDITFFGEDLPKNFHSHLKKDTAKCDLLICIGTSLKVAPVSEIVTQVSPDIPQIFINKDPVLHTNFDITLLGLSDLAVEYICQNMSWDFYHEMLTRKKILTKEIVPGTFKVELADSQ